MRSRGLWFSRTGLMRQVTVLALPLIAQNLSFTLLGFTDTFFVSRVSTDSVGALGLAGAFFFSIMLFFRNTANSSVVFVGRAHGAKDDEGVGQAVWDVLNLIGLLSIVALAMPWVVQMLFGLLASDETIRTLGKQYLFIRTFEIPFAMFGAVVWGFLIGRNDSRTPMLLAWLQVGLNIIFDALLVPGYGALPSYGVQGAAVATLMATIITTVVSALILWQPKYRLKYGLGRVRRSSSKALWRVAKVGVPMGLGDCIEVSNFTIFFAIIERISVEALAANQIALQYMSLSFTLGIAVAMAASSLVAQYLGAGEPEEAERVGYLATLLASVIMSIIGLSYLIAPEVLMGIFTQDESVILTGVMILKLVAFYQVADAVMIALGGSLNGAGDTTFTMVMKMIFGYVLFLPCAWLFGHTFGWGVIGAWVAALAYLGSLSLVYFLRFRSGRWKTILSDADAQEESVPVTTS